MYNSGHVHRIEYISQVSILSLWLWFNNLYKHVSSDLSFIFIVQSYARHSNILTNQTTAVSVFSV